MSITEQAFAFATLLVQSMSRSGWRWKDLNVVFNDGRSPLLNSVGTLCILFEDYRIETDALMSMRGASLSQETEFRQFYYVRRSLVTLHSYRDSLNELCSTQEYISRRSFIAAEQLSDINDAHSYLNKNDALRAFRNYLGAHLHSDLVKHSIQHSGANAISSVGWETTGESFTLKMPFATDLVRGGFASKLPGGIDQLRVEIEAFFEVMVEAIKRVSLATHALVLAFLWDRFGGA